jgi:DNA replication protein DnaC
MLGDPDCPYCGGVGYLRLELPIDHPDFGKLEICTCRRAKVSAQVHRKLFTLSNLDELHHLTFENFQPRGRIGLGKLQADSIEFAYNQSRQFAQNLKGWLFLQGPYGCGKTHLAAAIANFAVDIGVPTLFLTVPDLLDSLRFAYSDPGATFEDRFEEIRRSTLLVMDDFGTQNATAWAQEKLFQIVNYRYINRLPTVVTSNNSLPEIEERIRSRLRDPELVTRATIEAPDFRNPTDEMGHSDISALRDLSKLTFGSFSDRRGEGLTAADLENLRKAVEIAHEFAEEPEGWLVLIGNHAAGKTHLAAAIGNYRANLGAPPVFLSAIEFLDHLRATFNPNSTVRYDRQFDGAKNARLLILDGLGTQSMTPWAREKIFQLFDHRYNTKLPTVITMADELEDLYTREPALASRMMDRRLCTVFAITAPPYTGGPNPREARRKRRTPRS